MMVGGANGRLELCPVQVNLLVPISYLIFWVVLLCFSLYSEPVVCGLGMVIMLTGVPVYFVGVWWKDKPKWISRLVGERTFATAPVAPPLSVFNIPCGVLQKKSHIWARRCVTWCFLRKTLQSLNPSLPPKLPTKLLRPPESSATASVLAFICSLFVFLQTLYSQCSPFVCCCFFFNLVCELMCLTRVYLHIRIV